MYALASLYTVVCVCVRARVCVHMWSTAWASVLFSFTEINFKSKFKKGQGKHRQHTNTKMRQSEKLQISNDIYPPICNGHVSKRLLFLLLKNENRTSSHAFLNKTL